MRNDERELEAIIGKLRDNLDLVAVILFGSRARGDHHRYSDYDVLIIARFKEPYLERINKVLEVLEYTRLPIEVHPYTLEEAMKMLRKGNPIIFDALDEGKILYKTRDLNKLLKLFNKLKKLGMRRTETSIIIPEHSL